MALDPNIILGIKPVQIADPYEAQQKALSMRQMVQRTQLQDQEIQSQQGMRDAYRKNMTTGPDGRPTVNMKGVIDSAMQVDPQKGMELQTTAAQSEFQQKQAQMKAFSDQIATAHELAGSMQDETSYQAARQKGIELGLPNAEKLPHKFYPIFVKELFTRTSSTKEKFEQANSDRTYQTKVQENKIKHEENAIKRDQVSADKVDKLAQNFKKDLDPDSARSGNFGQISAKYQSGERLKTLVGAFKDQNLPPAQMEEMALGLANMLAPGGGQSRAQVEALVPHTAMGDTQKLKAWFLNEPLGANQQKFVEMMSHTVDREMETAQNQLNGIRAKRLSAHERFKKAAPDQYNQMLADYGIDPKSVKNGKYTPPPKTEFDHMSDDELAALVKAHGG